MAINFPDNPTIGDTYTSGQRTWKWDGVSWNAYGIVPDPTVLRVDSVNGRVGINNSSPAADLDVTGDINLTGNITVGGSYVGLSLDAITDADDDTKIQVESSVDNDTITFTTGATPRYEITSSGHFVPQENEAYDLGTSSNRFRDLYLSGSSIDLGGVSITSDGTNLALPPISSVSGDFTVDTSTLHVDATNNRVGIGTTAPSYPLEVDGSVLVEEGTLRINRASGTQAASAGNIIFQVDGSNWATIQQDSAGLLRINSSTVWLDGNVGIGDDTPSYKLDVNGTARFTDQVYVQSILNVTNDLKVDTDTLFVDVSTDRVGINDNTPSYSLDVNGTFRSTGNAYVNTDLTVGTVGANGNATITIMAQEGYYPIMYFGDGGTNEWHYEASPGGGSFAFVESNVAQRFVIYAGGGAWVSGYLNKSGGGFRIPHPHPDLNETHDLVHNFVEAPQADNIYRGRVQLSDGTASVNIDTASGMTDGTFVLLNRDIQCFTSNEEGPCGVWGYVEGNTLHVTAQHADCNHTISWMVIGERQDEFMITGTDATDDSGKVIVEPLKREDTSSDFVV